MYSHIFLHLKKYNILTEEQHGFRQNRSCETQLIATVNDLAEGLNTGNQTDVILLDFSKAFDKVPHVRLCHKLHHLGINGSLLTWIKHFLTNRQQQVVVNGESSSPSLVTSGVPYLPPSYFYATLMTLQQTFIQKLNFMPMMS